MSEAFFLLSTFPFQTSHSGNYSPKDRPASPLAVNVVEGKSYTAIAQVVDRNNTMPKNGTWSWTLQAFNQGANGNYFEASNVINGNDFTTKAADVPEDAVTLNVADFNAFLIDKDSPYYVEGKNGWVLIFRTGEEGYPGFPVGW